MQPKIQKYNFYHLEDLNWLSMYLTQTPPRILLNILCPIAYDNR